MLPAIVIRVLIFVLGHLLSWRRGVSPRRCSVVYECGFLGLGGGRRVIPLIFFLIAVLFLLFDAELLMLIPIGVVSLRP